VQVAFGALYLGSWGGRSYVVFENPFEEGPRYMQNIGRFREIVADNWFR